MQTLNEKDLFKLLADEEREEHKNLIFEISQSTNFDLSKVGSYNKFTDCIFRGERIDFSNWSVTADSDLQPSFHFEKCELLNPVFFKDCFVQELSFSQISGIVKNLHLASMKMGFFHFQSDRKSEEENDSEINITINNCEIEYNIDFLHLRSNGNLLILHSIVEHVKIHDCKFGRIDIDHNKFSTEFQFTSNEIGDSYFRNNAFEKSNFSLTDFGLDSEFDSNDFKGTALFERLKNEDRTKVKFKSCNFHKYTHFNKSKLYELRIETSKFQEIVSFQDLELNSILLDTTIFEKPAFFDDIEIHRFNKCNKRTLRNIKQQLLRADNKIDYDNFRAHELSSYKEELKIRILKGKNRIKRRKLKRDLTILRVNNFFSNNGTDWVRALKRTVLIAILFYSIFYFIYNWSKDFYILGYNEYLTGLFRYFLLTDFHNPLIEKKEYLVSFWQWIPFVFGKIFIAIGIFEILVSFRKFRK